MVNSAALYRSRGKGIGDVDLYNTYTSIHETSLSGSGIARIVSGYSDNTVLPEHPTFHLQAE